MKIDVANLLFTGRGSSALWAILKSINKPEAKVLLPVNICEIVYPIVINAGYEPIFYDVNSISGNASLEDIRNAYTGNEALLIAVHNFGIPLEIDEISKWAKEKNIFVIEDVCNAMGATYKGAPLGTFGDAAFFSFGYAKIIEYGLGGAASIKDSNLKSKVKYIISSMKDYSELHKNKNTEYQNKLREIRQQTDAQSPSVYLPLYTEYANYLLYKIDFKTENEIKQFIEKLDTNLKEREQKALRYRNEIKSDKVKHINEVFGQIYWRYNLLVDSEIRKSLILKLRENNIFVSTWFPPINELFEENIDTHSYSGSKTFSKEVINLFVDHRVSQEEISKTIKIINQF